MHIFLAFLDSVRSNIMSDQQLPHTPPHPPSDRPRSPALMPHESTASTEGHVRLGHPMGPPTQVEMTMPPLSLENTDRSRIQRNLDDDFAQVRVGDHQEEVHRVRRHSHMSRGSQSYRIVRLDDYRDLSDLLGCAPHRQRAVRAMRDNNLGRFTCFQCMHWCTTVYYKSPCGCPFCAECFARVVDYINYQMRCPGCDERLSLRTGSVLIVP